MKPESEQQSYARWLKAANCLEPHGWRAIGGWLFVKDGHKYDLSAADIEQHERIARDGLFRLS